MAWTLCPEMASESISKHCHPELDSGSVPAGAAVSCDRREILSQASGRTYLAWSEHVAGEPFSTDPESSSG